MIHSVPTSPPAAACETTGRAPHPSLRQHVAGYGGFCSGTGRAVAHRLLPFGLVTLILDPAEGLLATGARPRMTQAGPTTWGSGVTVALTPAGVPALLGVPMRELTGRTVPLADLTGPRAAELADRLAARRTWPGRFDLLDDLLTGWLRPGHRPGHHPLRGTAPHPAPQAARPGGRVPWADRHGPDRATLAAWGLLHRSPGRLRVAAVAATVGVPRRQLERAFQQQFGMSPGAVRRVARFQRAAALIGHGVALAAVAARSGYADQSHLCRETRDLAGWTPGELRAIVQYREMGTA